MLDLVQVTAPATEPVDLDQVKLHLHVDDNDQDGLIEAYIASATAYLDGPAGILGRAMVRQSWKLYLDRFPWASAHVHALMTRLGHGRHLLHRAAIRLPLPPLISVDEITYVDTSGVQQTLDPAQYIVRDGEIAAVEPVYGTSWPSARCQARAVSVTFTCGYGDATDVPKPLQAAILLQTGDLFETRETQLIAERAASAESDTFRRLVAPYRIART
jgi:hypothetical protein